MVLLLPFLPFSNPFYTNNQTDFFFKSDNIKILLKALHFPQGYSTKA